MDPVRRTSDQKISDIITFRQSARILEHLTPLKKLEIDATEKLKTIEDYQPCLMTFLLQLDPKDEDSGYGNLEKTQALVNFKKSPSYNKFLLDTLSALDQLSVFTQSTHFNNLATRKYLALNTQNLDSANSLYHNVLFEMYQTTCFDIQKIAALIEVTKNSHLPENINLLDTLHDICNSIIEETRGGTCGPGVIIYIENACKEAKNLIFKKSITEKISERKNLIAKQYITAFVNMYFIKNGRAQQGNQIHVISTWNNYLASNFGLDRQEDHFDNSAVYVNSVERFIQKKLNFFLNTELAIVKVAQSLADDMILEVYNKVASKTKNQTVAGIVNNLLQNPNSALNGFSYVNIAELDENYFPTDKIFRSSVPLTLEILSKLEERDQEEIDRDEKYKISAIEDSVSFTTSSDSGLERVNILRSGSLIWKTSSTTGHKKRFPILASDLDLYVNEYLTKESHDSLNKNIIFLRSMLQEVESTTGINLPFFQINLNNFDFIKHICDEYSSDLIDTNLISENIYDIEKLMIKVYLSENYPELKLKQRNLLEKIISIYSTMGVLATKDVKYLTVQERWLAFKTLMNQDGKIIPSGLSDELRDSIKNCFFQEDTPDDFLKELALSLPENTVKDILLIIPEISCDSVAQVQKRNTFLGLIGLSDKLLNIAFLLNDKILDVKLIKSCINRNNVHYYNPINEDNLLHQLARHRTGYLITEDRKVHQEIARHFFRNGGRLTKNKNGDTALHLAVRRGNYALFNAIYQYAPEQFFSATNWANCEGDTPFSLTCNGITTCYLDQEVWCKANCLAIKYRQYKNINELNSNGYSRLHRAVLSENIVLIEALLIAGANVHIKTPYWGGETPLHLAYRDARNFRVISTLIKYGANPNMNNSFGERPDSLRPIRIAKPTVLLELSSENALDDFDDFCD